MTATPDDVIAELQRANAELRRERDAVLLEKATLAEELTARTAELADRKTEFDERIEHQSATIDVLKAMSASPGDAQPVFDLIARQAANQCNVPTTAVATFDGTMMHLASESGLGAAYVAQFPRPVGLDFSMGRAVLNRRVDQVEDITAYPGHSFVDVLGNWSVMAVPMLRHDVPLGAITIGRPAIGPFSASQVALLQTFAEQAVIAISSAETYRALKPARAIFKSRWIPDRNQRRDPRRPRRGREGQSHDRSRLPRIEICPGQSHPGGEDGFVGPAHSRHRARDQEPAKLRQQLRGTLSRFAGGTQARDLSGPSPR